MCSLAAHPSPAPLAVPATPPPSPLHFRTYPVTPASPDGSGPASCVNSLRTRQEERDRGAWHAGSTCGENALFL